MECHIISEIVYTIGVKSKYDYINIGNMVRFDFFIRSDIYKDED